MARIPGADTNLSRRRVLQAGSALGAAAAVASRTRGQTRPARREEAVHVALVGHGLRGWALLMALVKIAGVRIRALCDVRKYQLRIATRWLGRFGHDVKGFVRFDEMLTSVKGLDAVFLATPDWLHAPQALAAMNAGLHVYCETPMATTVADAAKMVRLARRKRLLLQVGLQRRSWPVYREGMRFVHERGLLGRPVHARAHWHGLLRRRVPRKHDAVDAEVLKKAGYGTVERLLNWWNHPPFACSRVVRRACHQVDVLNWALGGPPRAVSAHAYQLDTKKGPFPDHADALYEWRPPGAKGGAVLGSYRMLCSTTHGASAETILGTEGALVLSMWSGVGLGVGPGMWRYVRAPELAWEKTKEMRQAKRKLLGADDGPDRGWNSPSRDLLPGELRPTAFDLMTGDEYGDSPYPIPAEAAAGRPPLTCMPHLRNFLDAIRGSSKTSLTCPGEIGYEALASALAIDTAIKSATKVPLPPEGFRI